MTWRFMPGTAAGPRPYTSPSPWLMPLPIRTSRRIIRRSASVYAESCIRSHSLTAPCGSYETRSNNTRVNVSYIVHSPLDNKSSLYREPFTADVLGMALGQSVFGIRLKDSRREALFVFYIRAGWPGAFSGMESIEGREQQNRTSKCRCQRTAPRDQSNSRQSRGLLPCMARCLEMPP